VALALFSIGWIIAWIATSIVYRRKAHKPLFPRVPNDAVFAETRLSGRSLRNWVTRIGGASNCLLVYVSDSALTIVPMFPFNLMFLPEVYGLETTVPARAVRLEGSGGSRRQRLVLIVDGSVEQRFEISIRDRDALERALRGQ
jgi:hypothetical protein